MTCERVTSESNRKGSFVARIDSCLKYSSFDVAPHLEPVCSFGEVPLSTAALADFVEISPAERKRRRFIM